MCFDRNGYGFELEKGQQSRKAENEVKSQGCRWCLCREKAEGLKKNPKNVWINIFAVIYNNIYFIDSIFDIIVCLIHKIGMKEWHV